MSESKYHHLYVKEQEYIEYNKSDKLLSGDRGEHTITIKLPTVESFYGKPWDEAIKLIDGYGLPPNEQKYDTYRDKGYYNIPPKLESLAEVISRRKKVKETDKKSIYPDECFDEIEQNPVYYKDEIAWIKLQRKRSIQGYWCFINGRPTYIDGWHYTYINHWRIGNEKRIDSLPFFRDVDRRIFIFFKWAYTTTETTYKYELTYRKGEKIVRRYFNNKGNAQFAARMEGVLPSETIINEGKFVRDKGHRTVFGVVFPKRRRVGATFMGSHVGTRIASDNRMGTFAIQALTKETAKDDVFGSKVRDPFESYPFYYKPTHTAHATNQIKFVPRKGVSLGTNIYPHGGWIIPRSSENKAFDGNKLYAYLNDESGKKKDANILHEFTDTIKNALAQGEDIHGFALYTSTFGEFESGGGKEYFDLCKKSLAHKRDDNGFTQTGLVTLFIPAYDGLDGYVDEFGYSVIEDPEFPYKNMEGKIKTEGAKTYLTNKRKFLEEMQDWAGLAAVMRNEPFDLKEASSPTINTDFWDINILRQQISKLSYEETNATYEADLEWEDGKRFNTVNVVQPKDGKKGKWIISRLPPKEDRNKIEWDGSSNWYKPQTAYMGSYILGTDPFYYNVQDVSGKKKSNGGGAMFMCFDPLIDAKDSTEKITERFTMTYCNRPDTVDEYCEDMLMAAVLCNAMVMTETNVPHILDKFREWGAGGYIMYMTDANGIISKTAGIRTTVEVKQKIFSAYGDYLKHNGTREKHLELLQEIMEAESFDDMTRLDLFAAGGMALLGAKSRYIEILKKDDKGDEGFSNFIELYD